MIKNIIIFILVIMILVLYFSSKNQVLSQLLSQILILLINRLEKNILRNVISILILKKFLKFANKTWKTKELPIEIQKLRQKKKNKS